MPKVTFIKIKNNFYPQLLMLRKMKMSCGDGLRIMKYKYGDQLSQYTAFPKLIFTGGLTLAPCPKVIGIPPPLE